MLWMVGKYFLKSNCKCLKWIIFFYCLCPVKRMVDKGKEILEKNNITDLSDVRWVLFWYFTAFYGNLL